MDPARFTVRTIPQRLADVGDPWARMQENPGRIDTLLGWWERDVENGLGEMPFPPEFPKMPGEPPRVQPSKKVAANWDEDGTRRGAARSLSEDGAPATTETKRGLLRDHCVSSHCSFVAARSTTPREGGRYSRGTASGAFHSMTSARS